MRLENDLNFFCDILNKCHVHTSFLSADDNLGAAVDPRFNSIAAYFSKFDRTVQSTLGEIKSKTKYLLCNEYKLRYVTLRLPIPSEKNILFIGPYLSSHMSSRDILELGEKTAIDPNLQRLLKEYYATVPVLPENDRIFDVINTFCERIWQVSSFAIVELNKTYALPPVSSDGALRGESGEEILASAEMMEQRYAFENELMRAVSQGQQHKESLLMSAINEQMFEKRLRDPVRNAKNYCIIMNTLLRKAAEKGGVHPIYLDRLSSDIAAKIEQISNTDKVAPLMREIFSSYCRLVRKRSTNRLSPNIKKAVIVIESDISAELSLASLARQLDVSCGYLATAFKRETGKTVSEYVREKRVEHAKYLLSATHLQVQTVAMHCGIMDVQYFSKVFKRQTGKTPREYRASVRE